MDETGIAWSTDKNNKFVQPHGFQSAPATATQSCSDVGLPSNCKTYTDPKTNTISKYYYPHDDSIQYLYEAYPQHISPIEGVTNEHFMVWMRTAGLPTFRKLYGKINGNFKKGDLLSFQLQLNYEVQSFGGTKALVISTVGQFGGKNPYLGTAFLVVGSLSLLLAFMFIAKQAISEKRNLGDTNLLNWGM